MLTISTIKNSAGAAIYYTKEDNYYLAEVATEQYSQWWGAGAAKLGLTGKKVEVNELQQIMEGRLPNGVTIGLRKDGSRGKHRAGYDLCFHAPKSVSILALNGSDKRFYEAHLEAVKETLKVIEADCAQARVHRGKEIDFENTKNLTVALVRHTASRSLDPHLHHHALIMNTTERTDKTWKALASSIAKNKAIKGFMERIYRNQIYYGLIYRSTLANKIQELGCEIEVVGRHGMWEIKGVPKEAIEVMSKRRQEIEGVLNQLNYHSFKAADIAALDSRAKKPKNLKWAGMQQTWTKELAKVGFSAQEFLADLERNKSNKLMDIAKVDIAKELTTLNQLQKGTGLNSAIDTVKAATWQLSQYELKLDYPKIISQALEFAMGKTTHGELVSAANQLIKEGFLISLDKSDTAFITKELIETEKAVMDLVDHGKKQWLGFTLKDRGSNGNDLSNIIPNESQQSAMDILQSKQRLSLVESTGANHRELMAAILALGETAGKNVKILSPNRLIANDLNENITRPKPTNLWQWLVSLGRPEIGDTLAGFIHKYREEIDLPAFLLRFKQGKEVIMVNHAETLGGSDLKTLLELTAKSQAKVILLQDTTDRRSLGAGNPLETLKQAGVERFRLTTPVKENLTNLNDDSPSARIIPELKAIKDDQQRTVQLAKEYAQREDRATCLVLVNAKNQLKTTNEAIRRELKEMGKISGLEHQVPILNPVYLSPAEVGLAHKYQQNMVIRFYNGVPEDWQVVSCNRETNTLRLVHGKRMMAWNPKQQRVGDQCQYRVKHGVFKKETLSIAQGDRLIATGNMRGLGIKNGTKFTIGVINEKAIELLSAPRKTRGAKEPQEPKPIRINLEVLKNGHFQYDYATTLNRSLKRPVADLIVDFKAYSLDKPSIDSLTKQAKERLTIFTNDGAAAQKRFGHVPVRLTAVETVLDASLGANKVIAGIDNKTDNQVVRTLTDQTVIEIKADLEKALGVLKAKYEFRSRDESQAVEFALAKITSRHAGFEHGELVKEALTFALEELVSKQNRAVSLQDIEKVIAKKQASGELVLGKPAQDGIKYTTKEQLELERAIIAGLKKGVNKLEPLLDPKALKTLNVPSESIKLTQDQKNAIALITTTRDQYVIVQGYAGTGKTTMYRQVHQMLKEKYRESGRKVTMLGVAPTHKAKRELEDIGIKAQSLKSFLLEQKRIEKKPGEQETQMGIINNSAIQKINRLDHKLIILDEASMASTQELLEFIKTTSKSKAHAVINGDMAQLLSVGAGKPHEDAVKSNVLKIVHLKEIVRQESPNLKAAVESTIKKDYAGALAKIERENPQNYVTRLSPGQLKNQDNLDLSFFNNLQKSVIEIDNNKLQPYEKTLEQVVADDYLTRIPEIRDKTVIIVHANEDRAIINGYIREGLKKQGVIAKSGLSVNRLTAKGFTDAEYRLMRSYNAGDILKLKNVYYRVVELDEVAQSLILKDGSGKTRYFYPEKEAARYNMELYRHTKEELAVGDVIRFTKTNKKRGLFANFEYRVKELDDQRAVLESIDQNQGNHKKQSQLTLNHRRLKDSHWDYAYTVTGYGVQGASKEYAIDVELSYRKILANVRSFYVGISRAIKHLIIYTDNQDRLLKQLLSNPGDKYSALEVVGELPGEGKVKEFADTKTSTQILAKQIKAEFYNLQEIKQALQSQAETIVEGLLGKPNEKLSSSQEWRYGNKGSLMVNLAADKRGLWKNFETGEGGRLLDLLQRELGLNFPDTLKYAADRFGGHLNLTSLTNNKGQAQTQSINTNTINSVTTNSKNISANAQKSKTSDYAQRLAQESLPIAGTVAEKYLKEHRGIKNIDSQDIRYHPKVFTVKNESQKYLPAMLSIGRDREGRIQCVQATYLDPQTANKAELAIKKRTYSSPSGALVSLQERQDNQNIRYNVDPKNTISFVAEGTETGLSVKDATRNIKNSEVVVTLGKSNFANLDPQSIGDKAIFCLDYDGIKTFTDNTIHKAAERLINHGKEVYVAIPQSNESNTKVDFNDVARTSGAAAVSKMLENSMPYREWASVKGIKLDPTLIGEVMQPKALSLNPNISLHNLLPSRPALDVNLATRFVDLEKSNLGKYLNTYDKIQRDLSSQKVAEMPKISLPNIQKDLSRIEKELY